MCMKRCAHVDQSKMTALRVTHAPRPGQYKRGQRIEVVHARSNHSSQQTQYRDTYPELLERPCKEWLDGVHASSDNS